MIDERACDLLAEMIKISSPSGQEGALATYVRDRMTDLGLRAWIDPVGNVVGETGDPSGPTVLLLGHLDTAGSPLPVRRSADRLAGRGAVDAKGPLATMIAAAARLPDVRCRLRVVGAVEEETPTSRGAVHLTGAGRPDAVVIGEPSGWSNVVIGYKGKLDLSFRARRPATHSSNPAQKATEAVVAFWQGLRDLLGPTGVRFDRPGAALESLRGDMTDATADIACRLPPGFDTSAFTVALARMAGSDEVFIRNAVAAARTSRSDPVVRHLTGSIRRHGGSPTHRLQAGTSDMNTLRAVWDVPIATYGPGDSSLDHSSDEHIALPEFVRSISVLTGAVHSLVDELVTGPDRRTADDLERCSP